MTATSSRFLRSSAVLAAAALFVVPQIAPPQDAAPASRNDPTLETRMKTINRTLRTVKAFLKDPKGDIPFEAVSTILMHAVAARDQKPEMTADKKPEEQPAFLLAYRKGMREMIVRILDLEIALHAKDWAAATKLVDAMEEQKKASHEEFKK